MNNPSKLLASHITSLKKKEASKPLRLPDNLLFWGTAADKSYLHNLKSCVGGLNPALRLDNPTTLTQVRMHASSKGITRIISSSPSLLAKALHWEERAAPKLSNYMGSYFFLPAFKEGEKPIELVFIPPLKQLVTVPYGKFLTTRYISKLIAPEKWYQATEFNWQLLTASNEANMYDYMSTSFLISIDIETFRESATIRCLSYTGFYYNNEGGIGSKSVVLPLDSTYALAIMRKWNWQLQAPKVFQNGKYDNAYLSRYNAPVYNYLYDTANMFHSYLSELPKDLGFLNAFFIREAMYWKDLAHTNDLHEYYRYNALDTWGTGNAFLAMLLEAPEYAISNYVQEFPLIFPCHMAEMIGIARDPEALAAARAEMQETIDTKSKSLNTILSVPAGHCFNVKSPPQIRALLDLLGCKDIKTGGEKDLIKARFRHPFNARLINLVLEIRKARTAMEKYLQVGDKAKEFHRLDGSGNRILWSLNPHGTDTTRLASQDHHFWCGLQVQNITRGRSIKQTFRADPDFLLCEVDLAQAESRDTAYISGDERLIQNVEHSPDFHCANASLFFGVPFEEIYSTEKGKVLNKPLRQLAKPVNHGANYNMGDYMLVQQMGEEMLLKAKHLLKLPRFWSYIEVAAYLLEQFHKGYPDIKGTFYKGVVNEILTTGYLTHHRPEGEPTLVRRCFGDPTRSKAILNSYIAHPPQSLNAQTLNKAWLRVFYDLSINPKHSSNIKVLAQIHDSILFQHRIGHEYLKPMIVDLMQIPVTLKSYRAGAVYKTFTVPADATTSAECWADLKD